MLRGNPWQEPERSHCCNAPVSIFARPTNGTFAHCWHCDEEVNDDGGKCTKSSRRYYFSDLEYAFSIITNTFKCATDSEPRKYSQRQVMMEKREAFFFGARVCQSTLTIEEIRKRAEDFYPFPEGMKDGLTPKQGEQT